MKSRMPGRRGRGILIGLLLLPLLQEAPVPSAAGSEAPLHLRVETLQVGAGGTTTLAADEADVLPGKGALLTKEVTLSSTAAGASGTEKLSLRAEIRVGSASPDQVVVTIRSRVNVLATTGGIPIPRSEIRREISSMVGEGTSQLFEVYSSPALGAKVTLNVRWFAGEGGAAAGSDQVPIPLNARIYEMESETPILLSDNQLLAAVGGTAAATGNRTVPLSETKAGEKRVRQDRVELTLSPRFQVGRSLSVSLAASGEVATLTPDGPISHPVSLVQDLMLSPGVPSTVEVVVSADDPTKEGWERVRFRLELSATF